MEDCVAAAHLANSVWKLGVFPDHGGDEPRGVKPTGRVQVPFHCAGRLAVAWFSAWASCNTTEMFANSVCRLFPGSPPCFILLRSASSRIAASFTVCAISSIL